MKAKIGIVSDHGGFELKEFLKQSLDKYEIIDYGTHTQESIDYPLVVQEACQKMLEGEVPALVALCGTGIGASIAANKISGVRAALFQPW